jgi:hypothetical protein
MTATVISLASRRRPQRRTTETCAACSRGTDGCIRECYPHRLDSLARRLTLEADATEGELLVDRDTFARAMADAVAVIASITDECLSADERSTR